MVLASVNPGMSLTNRPAGRFYARNVSKLAARLRVPLTGRSNVRLSAAQQVTFPSEFVWK